MAEAAAKLHTLALHGGYLDEPAEAPVGVGALGANIMMSHEQALMDAELVAFLNSLLEELQVNDDTLALEAIRRVGPSGNFVQDEHSLAHLHKPWFPTLFHRGTWDAWIAEGRKDPLSLAHEKVVQILSKPLERALPREKATRVIETLERAEKDILGKSTGLVP